VRVAIITDHPVVPVNYLLLCAQLAAKEGMPPDAALRAITCDAAEIAGIGGRVGKIKKGYDADMLIFNKNPMDFNANLLMAIIDGVKVNK
jgi:imidazolonepropionase-like amidohydrolase